MSSEIRVGIIGFGSFAEHHATAIDAVDGLVLSAICRTTKPALEEAATRLGVPGYDDYRALLDATDVDAVCIATPHHHHTDASLASAAARKHILLEKPMAPTLEECDRIIDACATADVTLMLGHVNHFYRPYRLAKPLLDAGELGEIVSADAVQIKDWNLPNRRSWHKERATGGGMWLTGGIHCIDRLTWLVGSPISRVAASFGTRYHDQDADDEGTVLVKYANGAIGVIQSTGYAVGVVDHRTILRCTGGTMRLERKDGAFIGRRDAWEQVPGSSGPDFRPDGLAAQWTAFRDAVRGDAEVAVTGDYARHIMAACFTAEEASRSNTELPVPPPRVTTW